MKIHLPILFVLTAGISFGQQKDSTKTKVPSFVIKFTNGGTNPAKFNFSNSEWERITPGFQVPDSMVSANNGNLYNGNGNVPNIHSFTNDAYYMLSFSLINGKNKQAGKKFRTTTAFHLGYGPHLQATKYWYREDKQVIDTLVSSQTGNSYYVVGNRRKDVARMYHSSTIAFGIGQHVSTNPDRVFMFETGLDVLCMMSIVSEVGSSYMDNYLLEGLPQPNGEPYYSPYPQPNLDLWERKEYSSQLVTGLIMRLPIDMSFKLSKQNPVVSRMRIGGELNPGLSMVFTKGKTTNGFNMSGGINFRFAI